MQIFPFPDSANARKNTNFNQYFAVAFDPIKICTHYAPQNDCWNLSFVKDIYVVAKKIARNGRKIAICNSPFVCIRIYL